jgi:uncharacterized protein (TIGR02391 family)
MTKFSIFDEETLRAICDILADTSTGLTGSEIGQLLQGCSIDDPNPTGTKRYRLFDALHQQLCRDNCGNNVIAFIHAAMNPVRYTRLPDVFESRRSQLNQVLSFSGLNLRADGKLQRIRVGKTLSDAQRRANKLHRVLSTRNVHPDVLRFCRAELLQDNYFHAVFEATKSIADKIRDKSGLTTDGGLLVDQAFGGNHPLLAFNTLQTETEKSEQRGLMNLLKGAFGTFRNTTAHAPRIKWRIKEQDALDMLTFASFLHRRLDDCVRTTP